MMAGSSDLFGVAAAEAVKVGVPQVEDQADTAAGMLPHAPVAGPENRRRVGVSPGGMVALEGRTLVSGKAGDRLAICVP